MNPKKKWSLSDSWSVKLLEVKKPPLLFIYFNYSSVHISAKTLRRWTAERTQNKVLRIPVMDKVETIKKEYTYLVNYEEVVYRTAL